MLAKWGAESDAAAASWFQSYGGLDVTVHCVMHHHWMRALCSAFLGLLLHAGTLQLTYNARVHP